LPVAILCYSLPVQRLFPDSATHDETDSPSHERREDRLRPPFGISRCGCVKKTFIRREDSYPGNSNEEHDENCDSLAVFD